MADATGIAGLDLATLQERIETGRRVYLDARASVAAALAAVFQNPDDAADALLDAAEEFGSEHAVALLQSDQTALSASLDEYRGGLSPEIADTIEKATETVLEARDELDLMTAERETRLSAEEPHRMRSVHVDGREFEIDAKANAIRATNDPTESYALDGPAKGGRDLTLSEELRFRDGIDRAEPRTPEPRERQR